MTIAKKIALLVLLGALALTLQGGFALWQLSRINEGVVETEQNLLPSVVTLDKAQIAFLRTCSRSSEQKREEGEMNEL
ncbi:hypothetical protein AB6Q56_02225 [Dechloromonas sp. ARDL1]|uniref:hypothetical protein n=1 Tax=Dechloromonas sp. ARDL1 TaxID=3322121 RepID=UPI003DA7151B